MPVPESIKNAPDLLFGLDLYYNAFQDLCGDITWRTINDYCNSLLLDEEQKEEMHYHLKRLNNIYYEHTQKKDS